MISISFQLLSSGLCQKGGTDKDGILGFLPKDIRAEVNRGKKLVSEGICWLAGFLWNMELMMVKLDSSLEFITLSAQSTLNVQRTYFNITTSIVDIAS